MAFGSVLLLKVEPEGLPLPNVKMITWRRLLHQPDGALNHDIYLRMAVDVAAEGWAHFDYVKIPEYRWGIFVAPQVEGRTIGFGKHKGQAVWNEVPGEYRSSLRRLIVTQGDTEPAFVEQQRMLGLT